MKKIPIIIGGTLVLLGSFIKPAHAEFNCGTGWTLYTVKNGSTTTGIRCVKYVPAAGSESDGYAWYGEGKNGYKYRHIGAVRFSSSNKFTGSSADINGNGEETNNFNDGTMVLNRSATTSYPATFTVQPWSETWNKESSAKTTAYTSPFTSPATDCGSNFYNSSKLKKFKAYQYSYSSTTSQIGIRCQLALSAYGEVWYGAGEIRSRSSEGTKPTPTAWSSPYSYAHLGARSGASFGQWDICQNTSYCTMRDFGKITISSVAMADTGSGAAVSASDMTKELWIPSRRKHSLRVRPIKVRDSAGVHETPVSAQDVLDLVKRANAIYGASTNTEFLFNRDYVGADGGLTQITDSTLNTFNQSGAGSTAYKYGNYYAERTPSDIVMIFTWGGTGSCPTGGGQSGSDWGFVSTVAIRPGGGCQDKNLCGVFDDGQFAHEVGHYLDLPHPFTTKTGNITYKSIVEASNALNSAGCDTSKAFDGDLISDTPPDPYNDEQNCNGATTIKFTTCGNPTINLPRTNIMSYWYSPNFPNDKTLTAKQKAKIDNLLSTSSLRQRLE
jgi:hypothetical protein